MALQGIPLHALEHGVPGIPDWVLQLVPDLPSLQDIVYRIASGIVSSYYHTGRVIVQRALSEEMQRLLNDLSDGFRYTFETLGRSDPVGAMIDQIQSAHRYFRRREQMLLIEGSDPIPFGEIASRAGEIAGNVAETVSNVVVDVANLPRDGYNALSEGIHRLGQWVQYAGSDGGTGHYSTPSWILYVLQELERELPKIPRTSLKRKDTDNVHNNNRPKKARARKNPSGPKASKSNQKRRSGSVRRRSTRTNNRV
ncbi:VP3 [Mus musculus polyomavirus 3]|nr:VP3 [Mus musculus polyomavirus 3]AWB14600.1 VP3 [Mus musculus polyomavirus 3]